MNAYLTEFIHEVSLEMPGNKSLGSQKPFSSGPCPHLFLRSFPSEEGRRAHREEEREKERAGERRLTELISFGGGFNYQTQNEVGLLRGASAGG